MSQTMVVIGGGVPGTYNKLYKIGQVGRDSGLEGQLSLDPGGRSFTGTLRTERFSPAGEAGFFRFRRVVLRAYTTGSWTLTFTVWVDDVQTKVYDQSNEQQGSTTFPLVDQTVQISAATTSYGKGETIIEADIDASGTHIQVQVDVESKDVIGYFLPESIEIHGQAIREARSRGAPATTGGASHIVVVPYTWLDYVPGDSLALATFTRASPATYVTAAGQVATAASGEIRDGHYVGGVRTLLLEDGSTNLLHYSEDLTTSWTARGTASVTSNDTLAPDGTATADKVSGLDNSAAGDLYESNAIPGGAGVTVQPSFYLKLASGTGTLRVRNASDGTKGDWDVDLSVLGTEWERIDRAHPAVTEQIAWTADVSGNAGVQFDDPSASGFAVWIWGVQLEELGYSTSYIKTPGAASASRVGDYLKLNWAYAPTAMTVYMKFREWATLKLNKSLFVFANASGSTPYFRGGDLNDNNTITIEHYGTGTTRFSAWTHGASDGDIVEFAAQLYPDGSVQIHGSVNGGDTEFGTRSSGETFAAAWSGQLFIPNEVGTGVDRGFGAAYHAIKVAPGVHTLEVMRSL